MSAPAPLTVRYTLTIDDFLDAQTTRMQRVLLLGTAVLGLAVVLGLVLAWSGDPAPGVLVAGVSLVGLAALHWRPARRSMIGRRVAPLIGTVNELTITDAGLEIVHSTSRGMLEWAGLTGVDETRGGVSVLTGGVVRMTIPKRAFASDAEARAFIEELRRRVGTGAR